LRAYVDKDRLDDIEVGNLGTLVKQMEITVSSGKMKCHEEIERKQNRTYSESRELEPDNEQRLECEIPRDVIEDNTKGE
jgi:hypothetical protein